MFSDVFSEFHLHQSSPHKFIGFSSSAGAIPPMAEMQAMWWCRLLEDKVKDSLGTAWSHLSLAKNWVLGCFGMFWVPKICSYCQEFLGIPRCPSFSDAMSSCARRDILWTAPAIDSPIPGSVKARGPGL